MEQKESSELSDKELLEVEKRLKPNTTMNAIFIGFLFGIIIYSIAVNNIGLVTLIPLYFAYRLINNSKKNNALQNNLKDRNLNNDGGDL